AIEATKALRSKGYEYDLVLTARVLSKETKKLINGLGWIKLMPSLNEAEHAAVMGYSAANLHTSFFEGGFTSIFSESLSVGVPVAISAIPSSIEVISFSSCPFLYFDPVDSGSLILLLENIIKERSKILDFQM